MDLTYIPLGELKPSPLNVRKHGDVSGADLIPSIRRKGVQQPLLVRPNCEGFEIVAGQRRFNASKALVEAGEVIDALPCIIIEDGSDAEAIEASAIENMERLPMDEIDEYHAFARLIEEGRTVADIAASFGVSERLVQQRLAISNLHEPILNAYRREEIGAGDIRLLTMATKRQQKAWWKLFRNEDEWAPRGHQLKQWLFGGRAVPTAHALFSLAAYDGGITADLFGDDSYFADVEQFWRLQAAAIAEKREAYLADGWQAVDICEIGQHWTSWEFVATAKEDGGRVYITCSHDGEVTCQEGFITAAEARKRERGEEDAEAKKAVRPELTASMRNYLSLHRLNAVRVELQGQSDMALRLTVAHMIAGSPLWQLKPNPCNVATDAIRQSVETSEAQACWNTFASDIRTLLGFEDEGAVVDHGWNGRDLYEVYAKLRELDDAQVMQVLAFVMAETLASSERLVDLIGTELSIDMRGHWQPDDTFFDLLRDKSALNAMVEELAGSEAAKAHVTATAKVQKGILKDCLNGTRKPQVDNWLPRYLAFPMGSYVTDVQP
tara:strand:- start:2987 stop:4642 length:1656 start_codon:yes stop_codon:yes gene_type:complete